LRLKIWILVLSLGALVLFWEIRHPLDRPLEIMVLIFGFLTLLAEALPVTLPKGGQTVSVGFAIVYAAVLIGGPYAGGLVAAIGAISIKELTGERPSFRTLYNCCQWFVSATLAGLVFVHTGGRPLEISFPGDVLALIASAAVLFTLNSFFTLAAVAWANRMSFVQVWWTSVRSVMASYLSLAPIGILLAVVFRYTGPAGVLLFLVPLAVARLSFHLFIKMRENYMETIKALIQTIEAKDPYTRGHSERVGELARDIARELELSEDRVEVLEFVGILHDVGKIGIREYVLNKPGRVTDEEREQIRQHAVIGADIIKEIGFLKPYASWLLYHHEWVNGMGYPAGLQAEEIPLEAKIIAVADAFDAMTSRRLYRDLWTVAKAVEELENYAGTQFDLRVVQALVRVLRKKGCIHTGAR
ncbi:MAG: HD-GYP domain-containing protein, partial [Firmicutes bacterium]|nr:HD-GYP domain-containing protein [Bacillota bacterium]